MVSEEMGTEIFRNV